VILDAHQHFWRYGTYQTSRMDVRPYADDPVFAPIRRSFQLDDLWPQMEAVGVRRTIAIEAAERAQENEALLSHTRAHEWIAGVVGWIRFEPWRSLLARAARAPVRSSSLGGAADVRQRLAGRGRSRRL
jgi:L-fuconolactonase